MSHKLVSLYIGDGEYYTRTDADAVIAELKADYKEACDRLQTANLIKDEQLAATRYHKFKRCLAMAMWCKSKSEIYNEFAADAAEYMSSYEARFRRKAEHNEKCREWAKNHRDKARRFSRNYYWEHKEERNAASKKWRDEHKEIYNTRMRAYRKRQKEQKQAQNH